MKTIQLQFSTTNGPLAKLIRWSRDSEISHVDVVTEDGKLLGSQLHEKDGDGVLVREPDYEKFSETILITVAVTDEKYDEFWKFLYAQVGKAYDCEAILGLAFHRDWRDDSKWFCSELVAAALEIADLVRIDTQLNWVDPQTLLLLVCASPIFVSEVKKKELTSSS